MRTRGFTLVELIMVIMITGILAASLTVFLKPAIDSYFDTRRRADLTDMADTALRRMSQDIRSAVPNSVRSVSTTCFQLVPTIAGGRYRMASDTVNDAPPPLPCDPLVSATCSAPLDGSQATKVFDVLSPMATVPAVGDWVVIGNQNAGDVYTGTNRAKINAIPVPPTRASDGLHRIVLTAATQFPIGYDGGRFVVVPKATQTVFYTCHGRTLYRGFVNSLTSVFTQLADQTACTDAGGAVVATDVENCSFVYDPNQGATQQSGFVWMRLELSRSGESATLAHGVHVDNVP